MSREMEHEIEPLSVEGLQSVLSQYDAVLDGENHRVRFPNGYGASIIRNRMSFGGDGGLWELGVVRFTAEGWDNWTITGDTPVIGDDGIAGWLTVEEVAGYLLKISRLPRGEEK